MDSRTRIASKIFKEKRHVVYQLKVLFSSNACLFLLCMGHAFLIGGIIYSLINNTFGRIELGDYISIIQKFSYIYFSLIGIVSFVYFIIENRIGLGELFETIKNTNYKRDKLTILIILNFFATIVVSFVCIIFYYWQHRDIFYHSFSIKIFSSSFFEFFVIGFLSVLFSYWVSEIKNKVLKWSGFILFHVIFGYPGLWISQNLILSLILSEKRRIILDLTSFMPDGYMFTTDGYGVYPIQPHRVILSFAFIFIFISLIKISDKNKMVSVICGTVSIMFFALSTLPYSQISEGYRTADRFVSMHSEMKTYSIGRKSENPQFNVNKYDIKIYPWINFAANVLVTVDVSSLERYDFTLHNGFKIIKILDIDGNLLRFEQNDSYISVYSDGRDLEKIRFIYYGTGEPFYADFSSMCLPGGIAYVPIAGFNPIYYDEKLNENYTLTLYNNIQMPENTYFDIIVYSPKKVFCPLEKKGFNHFSGYSDGLTLLDGMYKSFQYEDIIIIYPYTADMSRSIYDKNELEKSMSIIKKYVGEDYYNNLDYIMIDWRSINTIPYRQYSNVLVVSTLNTEGLSEVIKEFGD